MLCKKFANCPVSKDYCHKIDYSALNGLSKDAHNKFHNKQQQPEQERLKQKKKN